MGNRGRYYSTGKGKKRRRGGGGKGFEGVLILLGLGAILALSLGQRDWGSILMWVMVGVWVLVAGLAVWGLKVRCTRERERRSLGMSGVDEMSGSEFEKYVGELLVSQGWQEVRAVGGSGEQVNGRGFRGDFGADLLGRKDGVMFAVQVKRYRGFVGVEAIYQILGGREYYKCAQTMVVTNSRFSDQAWELSGKTGTVLVDRRRLQEWIGEYEIVELPWWCVL